MRRVRLPAACAAARWVVAEANALLEAKALADEVYLGSGGVLTLPR